MWLSQSIPRAILTALFGYKQSKTVALGGFLGHGNMAFHASFCKKKNNHGWHHNQETFSSSEVSRFPQIFAPSPSEDALLLCISTAPVSKLWFFRLRFGLEPICLGGEDEAYCFTTGIRFRSLGASVFTSVFTLPFFSLCSQRAPAAEGIAIGFGFCFGAVGRPGASEWCLENSAQYWLRSDHKIPTMVDLIVIFLRASLMALHKAIIAIMIYIVMSSSTLLAPFRADVTLGVAVWGLCSLPRYHLATGARRLGMGQHHGL